MAAWEAAGPQRSAELDGRAAGARHQRRTETYTCWPTARSWPGLCPDQAHDRVSRQDRSENDHGLPARSAQRSAICRCGGPGRSIKGTFALTEFARRGRPGRRSGGTQAGQDRPRHGRRQSAGNAAGSHLRRQASAAARTGPVEFAIDGKDETAWTIDIGPGRSNVPRKAVSFWRSRSRLPAECRCKFHLVAESRRLEQRRQQEQQPGPVPLCRDHRRRRVGRPAAAGRSRDAGRRSGAAHAGPSRRTSSATGGRRCRSGTRPTTGSKRCGSSIRPERHNWLWRRASESRPTFLLTRGDFLKPAQPVESGTPAILHLLDVEHPTRLDFARWLVSRRSPTTARSIVNRIWQTYFGIGLVGTSEDLGCKANRLRIGELLDWLAVEFMDHGWRLKDLHRLIVRSATYRQSWACQPRAFGSRSPEPTAGPRLAFPSRGRRSARHGAWRPAGCSTRQLGGPSVCPPAPEFLFQPPASYGPKAWPHATGPNRYRRAIYTFRFRSVPYPMLQTFDAPNGDGACVRRVRSNTPLQALVTLNEPVFLDCARALARRTLAEGGSNDPERLAFAFRSAWAACPTRTKPESF